MKKAVYFIFLFFLLSASECGSEQITSCYPQRIKRTINEGAEATAITADYKYDENNRLDRVLWSNFLNDYYTYDEEGKVSIFNRINVQLYMRYESRYTYEDGLAIRVDEYRMRINNAQEDIDTIQTGYRLYAYSGSDVEIEEVYSQNESSTGFVLSSYNTFSYDINGNMISSVSQAKMDGDTLEYFTYSYDYLNHPFAVMDLPFDGTSHVSNILQKTNMINGKEFFYQMIMDPTSYPNQVNIKQGSYLVEVINITYSCD